ncbi:MAG TPA: YicC/YloC family endoribonuclease [Chitinophagaceae bacterium]|nr:YicC/YloC family endoribonuclease [Chitinophagaceae bacterium]
MLYSMTGFGREEAAIGAYQVMAEIKSLNGKQSDLNTRIAPLLRPYEHEIRSIINTRLGRGTIDITIQVKQDGVSKPMSINTNLALSYYRGISEIAAQLGLSQENILATLMGMPEVVSAEQDALSESDWLVMREVIVAAVEKLKLHRKVEGESLAEDLNNCINNIEQGLQQILPFEPLRIEKMRSRINTSLEDWVAAANIDKNRLEQEMIYYIEKIDFSEEKIRLVQHCNYFREILSNGEEMKGKKLGFVLQEVGREINTLGSKANDADIQKIIVNMKDQLEKAKEQVLNVL